jgi:hypothetical protein
MLIAASLCVGSVASFPTPAMAACQAGQPGCVLPVGEAPPPVVQRTTPPPVVVDEGGGFGLGWLAVLAVLAAIAALLLFVLDDDEEDLPVSP